MLLEELRALKETAWCNPKYRPFAEAMKNCALSLWDVKDAEARLARFADYFKVAFPETVASGGLLESPLQNIPAMQKEMEKQCGASLGGALWIKLDSHLAVSGSIKARGGIYEVLKLAETVALEKGLLQPGDDYSVFDTPKFREVFSGYSVAVGSTGNLGLSIGIMSAKLGFRVTVHMSADARQWKKDMLRSKGVKVVEYASDYSVAVTKGREEAKNDPTCHFVDDENSQTLFLGYAVAALRLQKQLEEKGIPVDDMHPLHVYLPCGVGGGPGGVAFGLKLVFGDHVKCFFAEPTHAPCMILGMATGKHNEISVADLGIDGITAADGLAVGRASGFVGKFMEPFLSGCYTITDERMYSLLRRLWDTEDIRLEPSALAGMYGAVMTQQHEAFRSFRSTGNTTHLVWATGGSMVPPEELGKYYEKGKD
ncbi:MAG: D-serine ammonia-lyase [Oscillospiraceae bacterium]|nr:D-serine ammonia-lyase [Oscillospiraceae bacterium]